MSFKDICGQEKPIAFLKNAMERGRVSHAYLFFGLSGVGKRTTAEIFARALNCREAPLDACGRCVSCLKMARENHPDILILKPEGQFIRIQEIRALQNQMRFKPFEGGKRVFILVDAERMNSAAANALLKTLEEPAPSNILILVSSRPHQLPLTILSRCQPLRFSPLSREQIASCLTERLKMERETASVLAASAGGSIGKALKLHKDTYLKAREDILRKIAAFRKEDPIGALSLVDVLGKERGALLEGLDILRTWYRDILVYRETGETDKLFHRDCLEALKVCAERMAVPDILQNMKTVSRACNAIERNANKQLTLETMLFRLVHPFS
jgi:DNA polymerase III subunit delta'